MLSLTCVPGQGNPTALFHWVKDGAEIATSQNVLISSAAMNDTGSYSCKVSNSVGEKISQAIALAIHGKERQLLTNHWSRVEQQNIIGPVRNLRWDHKLCDITFSSHIYYTDGDPQIC